MSKLQPQSFLSNLATVPVAEIPSQKPDLQSIKNVYFFDRRVPNPEYLDGLEYVPFRSCLLHNKSDNSESVMVQVRRNPKYYTYLKKTSYDTNTGEIIDDGEYLTDDLRSGNSRKIKAVNGFFDTFKGLYKDRQVSLFFYTLTIADKTGVSIKHITNVLKKRIIRNGGTCYGYLWIMEISEQGHIHYHLGLATNRINCRGKRLPEYLKLDNVWGARTQVEFVQKSVRYYLSKYFSKNSPRITGKRMFGKTISTQVDIDFPHSINNSEVTVKTGSNKDQETEVLNSGDNIVITSEKQRDNSVETPKNKEEIKSHNGEKQHNNCTPVLTNFGYLLSQVLSEIEFIQHNCENDNLNLTTQRRLN